MKRNNWLKWLNSNRRNSRKTPRPSLDQSRYSRQGFVMQSLEDRILMDATPMEAVATVTEPVVSAAIVTTDKMDYSPGETAIITAYNTEAEGVRIETGETVQFQVTRTDGVGDEPLGNLPWYVTDGVWDANGDQVLDEGYYVDADGDGTVDYGLFPDTDGQVNASIGTTWFVEDVNIS